MKRFITAGILFIAAQGYSQTSVKSQPYGAASLDQFVWSYSKNKAISEKPLIDFDVMDNWRGMGDYLAVSDDGSYFAYTINKMAYYVNGPGLWDIDTLIIQSTKNGERKVFAGVERGGFSSDSKQYIFQDGESLCFLQLGEMLVHKIPKVASYKISKNKWIAYQLKDKNGLILKNFSTGKEKQFASTVDYNFSNNGEWLVCKTDGKELLVYNLAAGTEKNFLGIEEYSFSANGKALILKTASVLQYFNLPQADVKNLCSIKEKTVIGNCNFDASGDQVVFTIVDSAHGNKTAIGYYKNGLDNEVLKINTDDFGTPPDPVTTGASFSDNGSYLLVSMQERQNAEKTQTENMPGLDLWSYKDLNLQPAQAKQLRNDVKFQGIYNIRTGKWVFLESDGKKLSQLQGDFAIVKKEATKVRGDRFWENIDDSCWVVSLKDGGHHLLPTKSHQFWFSPDGKYLVYLDVEKGFHYFSYDLHTAVVKDISENVPDNQFEFISRSHGGMSETGNLAAWIENHTSVLVYDNYDIWKLDLTGKQKAVNITNNFGQLSNTIFNLFSTGRLYSGLPTIKANEPLVLRGYNNETKQNGFYKKIGVDVATPTKLYCGDYFMTKNSDYHPLNNSERGMPPVRAKRSNTWIVQRQSANDAPNYYATSDFKSFRRLTNYQPHQGFQWLTEEVISFKHLDGKKGLGILYKPENFDPKKKYPVIIPFYENFSDRMHQFPIPSYINTPMRLAYSPIWFLNNGYLVFAPDVYTSGPSREAFNAIEGAVRHLKQLSYVDANKLGCGSFSRSGNLGTYIFTHSKSIAATATAQGFIFGNVVSRSLSLNEVGSTVLDQVEELSRLGSLFKNKDLWLDAMTVLNCEKANSSLLLYTSQKNLPTANDETIQIFNALRRLDKKVWMLVYDDGGHPLSDYNEMQDYSIRYTQFFDHYLKYAPAPQWMTQGIPYKLKGIESRYELDPRGTCASANGEPCIICNAWNDQYKRTPVMFQKQIKDWVLDKDIADELERKQNEKRKELDKEGEVQTREVLKRLNTPVKGTSY